MSCIICNNPCAKDSNICESLDCTAKSIYKYTNDNYVSDFIKNSKEEFIFIMSLAHYQHKSDVKYPINIVPNVIPKAITIIADTDIEIIDKSGMPAYETIKFFIKNALMEFKIVKKVIHGFDIYEFVYSDIIDTNFTDTTYLFHGSPCHNWYSIIDNGLKVFSKTPRMLNGNAFGNGIYLSSQLHTSAVYAETNKYFSQMIAPFNIIGVFEVIGDINKYCKGNNIYVVPDPTQLRLKYLIKYVKSEIVWKIDCPLSIYFTKSKTKLVKNAASYINKIKNKRLLMEIRNIMKQQTDDDVGEFKLLDIEYTNIWNVLIINIDKDSKLHGDMIKQNIDNIQLEIIFESSYPLSPPFVRVIRPTFRPLTGHVTQGGSICAEILTNQGWSPAINMESLLITIKAIISEDGRLGPNRVYSLETAKNSYKNMLQVHGWQ